MTWQKGVSPNPGGLTPRQIALKRRLEGMTQKAADALEYALEAGTVSERLAAAREVFDRAIGKPKQSGTIEVTHNASPHLAALVGMAAQTMARVQTIPENNSQVIDIVANPPIPLGSKDMNMARIEREDDERDE